jgi:hypothetical protein
LRDEEMEAPPPNGGLVCPIANRERKKAFTQVSEKDQTNLFPKIIFFEHANYSRCNED